MFSFFLTYNPINCTDIHQLIEKKMSLIFQRFPVKTTLSTIFHSDQIQLTVINPIENHISKLHHLYQNDEVLIYTFGTLFDYPGEDLSLFIYQIWKNENIKNLQKLDGQYTIIIFDKQTHDFTLVCDSQGFRRVKWMIKDQNIIISPHELSLYSSGLVSKTFLKKNIYEMLAFGSTLKGESLFSEILYQKPYEVIIIKNFQIIRSLSSYFQDLELISEKREQIDFINDIISKTRNSCKKYLKFAKGKVEFDLTAGKDTRSVLSLLYNLLPKENVLCRTRGEYFSQDSKTARKICKILKLAHNSIGLDNCKPDNFDMNVQTFSFFFNGDTNAGRALEDIQYTDIDKLRFGGVRTTPEWFYWLGMTKHNIITLDIAINFLINKYSDYKNIPTNIKEDIIIVIKEIYHDLELLNPNPDFMIKGLVQFTRFSNWSNIISHRNWQMQNIEPLFSIEFSRIYMQIPLIDSKDYLFYRQIIKNYTPNLMDLPINGDPFNRLTLVNKRSIRKLLVFSGKVFKKLKSYLKFKNSLIFEYSIGDAYKNKYYNKVRDSFYDSKLDKYGFISQKEIDEIIDNHKNNRVNFQNQIGILLTAEHFLKLMDEIDKMS